MLQRSAGIRDAREGEGGQPRLGALYLIALFASTGGHARSANQSKRRAKSRPQGAYLDDPEADQ